MRLRRLAARNLLRNRGRTLLTILGSAVAVLTFVMLRTAVASWTAAADYAAKDRIVTRHKVTLVMQLPKRYAEEIRSVPGVKGVTFASFFGARDPKAERDFFFNIGVESHTFFEVKDEMVVPEAQLAAWKADRRGAIVGDALAKKRGWKVGDRVILQGTIWPGDWEFHIAGIYTATRKSVDRSTFVFHWNYMNENSPPPLKDMIGWTIARLDRPGQSAAACAAIDRHFDERDIRTISQSEREFNTSFLGMLSTVLKAIDVVSVAILVVMMLILGNTVAMGVRERVGEHAILRAIGFPPDQICWMILGEAALTGLLAGALGLALSYPIVQQGIGRWVEENMGAFFPFFRVEPKIALIALGAPALLAFFAALPSAVGAMRIRVVDALRRVAGGEAMIPLNYDLRGLVVRRTSTIASALGIAAVVAVLAVALMTSEGIQRTVGGLGRPDTAIVLRKGSDSEMPSAVDLEALKLIAAAPGVASDTDGQPLVVGEVVVVLLGHKSDGSGMSNIQLRGVPDNVLKLRPEVRVVAGRAPRPGTAEAMIGQRLRGRFKGYALGGTIELRKNRPAEITGVFEAAGSSYESEVWAGVEAIRSAFGREAMVSSVRVRLQSRSAFDGFKAFVEQDKRLGLDAIQEPRYFEKLSEGTAKFFGMLGAVIAVFFSIGAMIGAMITMYAAVSDRKREIGVLRALGFSRAAILTSFLLESTLLAFAGGLLGVLAALGFGLVRLSAMNFQSWSEVVFSLTPTPAILITALVAACVMGILGGFLPALRAARTPPSAAMRG